MRNKSRNMKLAILVNTVAPYRIPIYRELGQVFSTKVFLSGAEKNRTTWNNSLYEDETFKVQKSWGITIQYRKKREEGVFDRKFFHLTPGYLMDLFLTRPDAVISNEMGFRSFAALCYGIVYRKPVWIWWGGTCHTELSIGYLKHIIRGFLARWVKRWISYGETSTEYLVSLGVARERILQIQNCVEDLVYSTATEPALDLSPKPVFLFVGQMLGRKGVKQLLDAVGRMQKEGFDFSLMLVGDGPEKTAMEAYAQHLALRNVSFHPSTQPHRMPEIYRSANYLVFPSLEDVWGLVVNEALLSGLPALSSIYAGCSQEIVPPQNRFDPLNPVDFDRVLRLALGGKLAPVDRTVLAPTAQVARWIIEDIKKVAEL